MSNVNRHLDVDATDDINIEIDGSNKHNVIGSNLGGGECGNKGDKEGKTGDYDNNGWKEVSKVQRNKGIVGQTKSNKEFPTETANKLHLLVGYIDLRFMCGKDFKVAGGVQTFITTEQAYNKHFTIIALSGAYQDIMRAADVSTTQSGIESYYRHHKGSNNIPGWLKIRTKYSISQLKQPSKSFKQYQLQSRVHINNAQLGEKEGIMLGWIWKSHPAFSYRGSMKEQLHEMLKDIAPMMEYALFAKTIPYQRQSDGKRVSMNAIEI
jgi:hypothetical protein